VKEGDSNKTIGEDKVTESGTVEERDKERNKGREKEREKVKETDIDNGGDRLTENECVREDVREKKDSRVTAKE